MSILLWRIAVVAVLAMLAGLGLGLLMEAMWADNAHDAATFTVLFGVPLVGALLSQWVAEATP